MSVQHHHAVARSINSVHGQLLRSLTEALLCRLLCGIARGQLVVDTPAGDRLVFDGERPGPQARFSIRSWRCLWARRKYKRLRHQTKGARDWFDRLHRANPRLFAHWQLCHGNGRTSGAV
jgi:hypothetical protein